MQEVFSNASYNEAGKAGVPVLGELVDLGLSAAMHSLEVPPSFLYL